jgi:hypothetical protein
MTLQIVQEFVGLDVGEVPHYDVSSLVCVVGQGKTLSAGIEDDLYPVSSKSLVDRLQTRKLDHIEVL